MREWERVGRKRERDWFNGCHNHTAENGDWVQGQQDLEAQALPQLGLCPHVSLQTSFILSGQLLHVEEERNKCSTGLTFLLFESQKEGGKGWVVSGGSPLFFTSYNIQLEKS